MGSGRTSSRAVVGTLLLAFVVNVSLVSSLSLPFGKRRRCAKMEATVKRYFEGVNAKDPDMIRSCFEDIDATKKDPTMATIRDVCALNTASRTVPVEDLVNRCMDFLTAHPDTVVDFYYGPECDRSGTFVFAHWYEVGTWSGKSCGLEPTNEPMQVEGQTRFRVCPKTFKIREFVVTRTFTDWENALQQKMATE